METLLMLSILILTIISAWFLGMAINYKRCADKNRATVEMYRDLHTTSTYVIEDHNVRSDS